MATEYSSLTFMATSGAMGFNQGMIDLHNRYYDSGILKDCKGISDVDRNLIISALKNATLDGRGIDWIVDQIVLQINDFSKERARLIARTETNTASNYASYVSAAKSGLLMKKEWLAANDSRTRQQHSELSGTIINMEDISPWEIVKCSFLGLECSQTVYQYHQSK